MSVPVTYYSGQTTTTNYTSVQSHTANQYYGSSVSHNPGIISSFIPGTFLNPQPVGTHNFRKSRWQHGITWDVPNSVWTSEGWSKCLTHETASSERQEWKLMLAPFDTIITSLQGEVLYDIKGTVISLGVGDELIIPAHMVYQLKVNSHQNAILCWAYRVEATREVIPAPKPKGKWIGRDIYVIVDSSASMSSQDPTDPQRRRYWQIARDAVMNQIVTKAIQHDKDGITLYFFDSKFTAYDTVNSTSRVGQIFNQYQPTGSTALHLVLRDAFGRYFGQTNHPLKPATLLIITDGSPDSKEEAENEIIQAARRVTSDYDLLIIFVQIGPDPGATQFLQYLDSGISKKTGGRDIVEVVKSWEMKGVSFEELISNTLND